MLLSSLPVGAIYVDTEGTLVRYNAAAARLVGGGKPLRSRAEWEEVLGVALAGPSFEARRMPGPINAAYELSCHAVLSGERHVGTWVLLYDTEAPSTQRGRETELLQTFSHEIRSPLTAIKNAVGIVRKNTQDAAEPLPRLVEIISRNVHKMVDLVDNVLEVGRLESGRIALNLRAVELAKSLRASVASFESNAALRRSTIEVRGLEALDWVHCDPFVVERVVDNLLSNAIKYTKVGTVVRVSIEYRREPAPNSGSERDDYLAANSLGHMRIEVADQGVGIAEHDRERVFERFVRIVREAHGGAQGTGLGLPIARMLARLHGGDLTVASIPGSGATFAFSFPVFDAQHAAQIMLARQIHMAREEGHHLGIVVIQHDAVAVTDKSRAALPQLASIAQQTLFRQADFATYLPASREIVLLVDAPTVAQLFLVARRVSKALRAHLMTEGVGRLPMSWGTGLVQRDATFEAALVELKAAKDDAENRRRPKRRRLLVADDDGEFIDTMRLLLERQGFEILGATSGTEALKLLQTDIPDAVLLDVLMPGHDGYRVCLEIRSQPELRDLPIFLVSGVSQDDPRAQALAAGGNEFVQKPCQMDDLVDLLRLYVG